MKFRDYYLTEATNYLAMFNDFIGHDNKDGLAAVKRYVDWAKQTLKKNDRIVWFLRFAKVELAGKIKNADMHVELEKLNKKLKTNYHYSDLIPLNNLMTNLAHFLTTPAPELQTIVFDKQSPRELIEQMTAVEDEWKGLVDDDADAAQMYKAGRLLRDEDEKVILKFPDGMTWFDLEKPYCKKEGKVMDHCGNSAAYNSDETILSLRKPVTFKDEVWWYPICTFILDGNGYIGEMKGRGNDKPAARYHKYIIALLRLDIIQGIKGGGYLAKNNFNMNDLPEDVREKLTDEKPGLKSIYDRYKKEGMTKTLVSVIKNIIDAKNYPTRDFEYLPEEEAFVVDRFRDLAQFFDFMNDRNCEKLLDVTLGKTEIDFSVSDAFSKTVQNLPEFWQEKLMKRAGVSDIESAIAVLIRTNDDYYAGFEDIFENSKNIIEEAWDRLADYCSVGWYFDAVHVFLNIPSANGAKLKAFVEAKQPVLAMVSESDMIHYASDDDDGYSDSEYTLYNRGNGYDWTNIGDSSSMTERRREDELIDEYDKDIWLREKGLNDSDEIDLTDKYLEYLSNRRISPKIRDDRQSEMKFGESTDLLRILRMAGVK